MANKKTQKKRARAARVKVAPQPGVVQLRGSTVILSGVPTAKVDAGRNALLAAGAADVLGDGPALTGRWVSPAAAKKAFEDFFAADASPLDDVMPDDTHYNDGDGFAGLAEKLLKA